VTFGEADEISNAMQLIQREEQNFAEFSAKAAAIWRADVEPSGLQEFLEVLSKKCPGRTLYRRQILSAFHLAFAQNACNFSVPGSGKTSIVYAAFAYLSSLDESADRNVNHLLVVGPLSSFKAWEDEFTAIFDHPPRSKRISGGIPPHERRSYLRGTDPRSRASELTLTSYQTLNLAEDDFRVFLNSSERRIMMVLDEAHNIKREDGEWASTALRLAPMARARVVLTGTPAPNGYEDLGNLFRFIYPDRHIIHFPAGTLRAMSTGSMPIAVENLKAMTRPFFTRIRKSDLSLPPIEEIRVESPLSDPHRKIYSGIERLIVPRLRFTGGGTASTLVRARLMRLRQAAVNPALLLRPLEEEGMLGIQESFSISELEIAEQVKSFQPEAQLARMSTTKEIVSRIIAEQGKVLIWSVFIGNLRLLHEALKESADRVDIITGATPVGGSEDESDIDLDTRERIIDRFNTRGKTSILIANPQAVGESVSLHKACHSAIYFDRDFNAGRFIQSKDRIHRYGLRREDVTRYYYLVAPRTVDEDIDQRLAFKEQRLADLIDSEEIPLFGLVEDDAGFAEDIRAVIRSYERRKTL
jgi:SNF2 family DNA or RNA helicase